MYSLRLSLAFSCYYLIFIWQKEKLSLIHSITMKQLLLLTLFLSLSPILFTAEAQKRAMTTDDALNMVDFGEAKISPDGNFVIWGKSELDWEENKRETTFFHTASDGKNTYQYLGEEGGSSLSFSPDGKFLAIKRTVEKKSQLFLMPVDGGEIGRAHV